MAKIYSAFVQVLFLTMLLLVILILLVSCVRNEASAKVSPGEEAFVRHCYVCHVQGGNVIVPTKTLYKSDLAKRGILTAADIVDKIRNPGPAMTKFDETMIPDRTARAIAEYVLNTFK